MAILNTKHVLWVGALIILSISNGWILPVFQGFSDGNNLTTSECRGYAGVWGEQGDREDRRGPQPTCGQKPRNFKEFTALGDVSSAPLAPLASENLWGVSFPWLLWLPNSCVPWLVANVWRHEAYRLIFLCLQARWDIASVAGLKTSWSHKERIVS